MMLRSRIPGTKWVHEDTAPVCAPHAFHHADATRLRLCLSASNVQRSTFEYPSCSELTGRHEVVIAFQDDSGTSATTDNVSRPRIWRLKPLNISITCTPIMYWNLRFTPLIRTRHRNSNSFKIGRKRLTTTRIFFPRYWHAPRVLRPNPCISHPEYVSLQFRFHSPARSVFWGSESCAHNLLGWDCTVTRIP